MIRYVLSLHIISDIYTASLVVVVHCCYCYKSHRTIILRLLCTNTNASILQYFRSRRHTHTHTQYQRNENDQFFETRLRNDDQSLGTNTYYKVTNKKHVKVKKKLQIILRRKYYSTSTSRLLYYPVF